VIVSWVREKGFFSDKQLRANKVSANGKKLWGKSNVVIFDQGSLGAGRPFETEAAPPLRSLPSPTTCFTVCPETLCKECHEPEHKERE
jgi:hypothetical protein